MRRHMDTTHSPQSSLVHECQNLTNPLPHGQNCCNKKQSPTPLDKKGAKTLSGPYQCPTLPRGAGVGVSIDKCFTSSCIPGLVLSFAVCPLWIVKRHFSSAFSRSFKSNTIMNIQNLTGKFYMITCARRSSHETTSKIWHGVQDGGLGSRLL